MSSFAHTHDNGRTLKMFGLCDVTAFVRHLITSQDDYDKATPDLTRITRHKWSYDSTTVRNILRAANSLALVWAIMADYADAKNIVYDAVIMLRPDVLYLKDIDVLRRKPVAPATVYLPAFQSWGGFNDRYAYGGKYAYEFNTPLLHFVTSLPYII
jgi:hypothetical protein